MPGYERVFRNSDPTNRLIPTISVNPERRLGVGDMSLPHQRSLPRPTYERHRFARTTTLLNYNMHIGPIFFEQVGAGFCSTFDGQDRHLNELYIGTHTSSVSSTSSFFRRNHLKNPPFGLAAFCKPCMRVRECGPAQTRITCVPSPPSEPSPPPEMCAACVRA